MPRQTLSPEALAKAAAQGVAIAMAVHEQASTTATKDPARIKKIYAGVPPDIFELTLAMVQGNWVLRSAQPATPQALQQMAPARG